MEMNGVVAGGSYAKRDNGEHTYLIDSRCGISIWQYRQMIRLSLQTTNSTVDFFVPLRIFQAHFFQDEYFETTINLDSYVESTPWTLVKTTMAITKQNEQFYQVELQRKRYQVFDYSVQGQAELMRFVENHAKDGAGKMEEVSDSLSMIFDNVHLLEIHYIKNPVIRYQNSNDNDIDLICRHLNRNRKLN